MFIYYVADGSEIYMRKSVCNGAMFYLCFTFGFYIFFNKVNRGRWFKILLIIVTYVTF